MPKYEDLEFIRDTILNIGDEINIKKKLGMSTEILPIPEKVEEPQEEVEDFEGLIDEIKEDFDKELMVETDVEEGEEAFINKDETGVDSFLASDKKEELDNAFEDILGLEAEEKKEEPEFKEEQGSDLSELLNNLGEEEVSISDREISERPKEEPLEQPVDFSLENESLVSEEPEKPEEEIDSDLEKLLSGVMDFQEPSKEQEISKEEFALSSEEISNLNIEETDLAQFSLDKNLQSEEIDSSLKELNGEKEEQSEDFFEEEHKDIGEMLVTDDNALKDLASDFLTTQEEFGESLEEKPFEKPEEISEISEFKETEFKEESISEIEEPKEEPLDFGNLDQLLQEKEKEKSNRAELLEVKEEEIPVDVSNIENLFGEPEEISEEKKEESLGIEETSEIEEVSSLESFEQGFDLGSLDQFEVKEEESREEKEEEKPIEEKIEIEEEKGEIKKTEKIKIGKDEIELTDEQIKKILLSLSSLPKEAHLKIAREIVSDKYSDKQLKPLIDALLEKEKLNNILRIYEKITGDKSLSKSTTVKYTGEEFEEKQKSFAYLFQKNILPILYRITAISIFSLIVLLLIINIIIPTMRASHYYNMGKKNIDQKKFNDVEIYFERAYQIQPRYNEVVIYARKYRENKRYLEAEKKYNLALRMRENRELKLEIADFFRETKDYERSIRNYLELKQQNDRDIKVLLGMAKAYYDWGQEIPSKLDDAKELYYDVLDIDKNNKDAIYGNLNIFIKQKNNEEILKYYRYIEKKFKKDIDPISYFNLAEYFIETNQIEEVKNVLDKSLAKANKLKLLTPEIDYLYSRYKKDLNIFNEEKVHLENALIKFERMKKEKPDLFGSEKYQKLLAKVYNDLGENYDRFSKASIDAEKYFNMAINTDPDYGKPYFNLANFELKYKVDMASARENYLTAEQKGFSNDRLNYNLGWIYFKQEEYLESFKRINRLLEKYPENTNLKFFLGTIFYKLQNFDFAEGFLLETYNYFNNLKQIYYPLGMDVKEDRIIADMLFKISNNLGATYQKKYEKTRNSKYLVWATKYYSESMEFHDKLKEYPLIEESKKEEISEAEVKLKKFEVTKATQNLRMVLYPDAGKDEPIIFEDFSLEYESSL